MRSVRARKFSSRSLQVSVPSRIAAACFVADQRGGIVGHVRLLVAGLDLRKNSAPQSRGVLHHHGRVARQVRNVRREAPISSIGAR